MGKQKQKTQTSNTFAYQTNPGSADIDALRSMKATTDPTIPFRYAKMREEADNSWANPFGPASSPAAQAAGRRVMNNSLGQEEAAATQASQFNADNQNYARQAGVAGLTAPQLTQTGGTTNSSQWGTGLYSPLGQLGLQTAANGKQAAMAKL